MPGGHTVRPPLGPQAQADPEQRMSPPPGGAFSPNSAGSSPASPPSLTSRARRRRGLPTFLHRRPPGPDPGPQRPPAGRETRRPSGCSRKTPSPWRCGPGSGANTRPAGSRDTGHRRPSEPPARGQAHASQARTMREPFTGMAAAGTPRPWLCELQLLSGHSTHCPVSEVTGTLPAEPLAQAATCGQHTLHACPPLERRAPSWHPGAERAPGARPDCAPTPGLRDLHGGSHGLFSLCSR